MVYKSYKTLSVQTFLKYPYFGLPNQSYFKNTPKDISTDFVFCFSICLDWRLDYLLSNVSLKVSIIIADIATVFSYTGTITGALLNQVHCATKLLTDNILSLHLFGSH